MRSPTLAALALVGCTLPTSPTSVPADLSPSGWFAIHSEGSPVDEGMRAQAEALWLQVRGCVGAGLGQVPPNPRAFPVYVVPEPFWCGLLAGGCFYGSSIRVVGKWFAPALRHELTNLAFFELGEPGDQETRLAFTNCSGDQPGSNSLQGT